MKTQDVIAKCRANRGEPGSAKIESKEVAVLIRARLKKCFPQVKFSVRTKCNSVSVYWTDGPTQRAVEREISEYSFGGFDGMIDMAYSADNWLLPDGSMEAAASEGTEGSRGVVPGYVSDCPMPGAVLVEYGPQYVFAQRTVSDERYRILADAVAERYGCEVDYDRPYWDQRTPNGEYLTSECLRLENKLAGIEA